MELPSFVYTLAYISLFGACARLAVRLTAFVKIYFQGPFLDFSQFGSWSVITGATDGIGLAFAHELAKKGQNIVLISRNLEKLASVSKDIENTHHVATKTIIADFANSAIYDSISEELKTVDIGVLVNNVGISYEYPELFLEIPNLSKFINDTISINIMSTLNMTKIVLPIMIAKKKGVILNISAGVAAYPTPMLSLYSASKQFVDCFSKCLSQEYGNEDIIIQCIMPFYVTTKLSKISEPSIPVPTPAKFVESALKTVGKEKRTHGYFVHALLDMFYDSIPEHVYMKAATKLNLITRHKALRENAARRQ